MMTRIWCKTNDLSTWKPKIEEHTFNDGSKHYSFRDRFGRPSDLRDFAEAQNIIKLWGMTEITEEMRKAGWIA